MPTASLRRDLNVLELLGVPYGTDKARGGYVIHHGWQFPVLSLSPAEALPRTARTQSKILSIQVRPLERLKP